MQSGGWQQTSSSRLLPVVAFNSSTQRTAPPLPLWPKRKVDARAIVLTRPATRPGWPSSPKQPLMVEPLERDALVAVGSASPHHFRLPRGCRRRTDRHSGYSSISAAGHWGSSIGRSRYSVVAVGAAAFAARGAVGWSHWAIRLRPRAERRRPLRWPPDSEELVLVSVHLGEPRGREVLEDVVDSVR